MEILAVFAGLAEEEVLEDLESFSGFSAETVVSAGLGPRWRIARMVAICSAVAVERSSIRVSTPSPTDWFLIEEIEEEVITISALVFILYI
jgi:hypothetical protein